MKRRFKVVIDGEEFDVEVEVEEGSSDLEVLLQALKTGVVRSVSMEPTVSGIEGAINAPITGKVVEIKVGLGEKVEQGDTVAILEAMKTRIEVRANKRGIVRELFVKEGTVVKQGEPLLVIA